MTFVFSPPKQLESPHKKEISDAAFHKKSNIAAYLSADRVTIWNLQYDSPSLIASISSRNPHNFSKVAFVDESILAVLTTTNRVYNISLKSFSISENFIDISSNEPIVFFQKVGEYIFALSNSCTIFYVNLRLTKVHTRTIKVGSTIRKAQSTSESLLILLESGQIAIMKQNNFDFLALPTSSNFCVDKGGKYICIKTNHRQWQTWSLSDVQFIQNVDGVDSSNFAVFSPISVSCFFFLSPSDPKATPDTISNSMKITHFSHVISNNILPFNAYQCIPIFDSYGQTMLISTGSNIYYVGLATASSIYSDQLSAPITSSHVLLPFREMLLPIKLPEDERGRLALFGESALAVATDHKVLILPFSEKICPSVSDGAAHSQFIKNTDILKELTNNLHNSKKGDKKENDLWHKVKIEKVRSFAWSSNILICLSGNKIYMINTKNNYSISLFSTGDKTNKIAPISLSASSNKLLIISESQLSFYNIDTQKLINTTSLGKTISIKSACFLSSETVATVTHDKRLLLIYHSNVHKTFNDCINIQLTGSNGWPLFIIGEKWRLLGANYSELDFDSTIDKALMAGVDGFSIVCLSPFELIEFVHLVVRQSLYEDSMASAVSILSQLSEERRIKILKMVGMSVTPRTFGLFLTLVDRYSEIEDCVLSYVFHLQNENRLKSIKEKSRIESKESDEQTNNENSNNTTPDSNANVKATKNLSSDGNRNKKRRTIGNQNGKGIKKSTRSFDSFCVSNPDEFFKICFTKGWYLAASELIWAVDRSDALSLLIKSDFDIEVVKQYFNCFPNDDLREIEDDITNFYRIKFVRNDFVQIAELLQFFEIPMKRFLLKTRRERESNQDTKFSIIVQQLLQCNRQQLTDLATVFESTNSLDLVFCCNFCIKNFAKCLECIERQQRMMKFIDSQMLNQIGYNR